MDKKQKDKEKHEKIKDLERQLNKLKLELDRYKWGANAENNAAYLLLKQNGLLWCFADEVKYCLLELERKCREFDKEFAKK